MMSSQLFSMVMLLMLGNAVLGNRLSSRDDSGLLTTQEVINGLRSVCDLVRLTNESIYSVPLKLLHLSGPIANTMVPIPNLLIMDPFRLFELSIGSLKFLQKSINAIGNVLHVNLGGQEVRKQKHLFRNDTEAMDSLSFRQEFLRILEDNQLDIDETENTDSINKTSPDAIFQSNFTTRSMASSIVLVLLLEEIYNVMASQTLAAHSDLSKEINEVKNFTAEPMIFSPTIRDVSAFDNSEMVNGSQPEVSSEFLESESTSETQLTQGTTEEPFQSSSFTISTTKAPKPTKKPPKKKKEKPNKKTTTAATTTTAPPLLTTLDVSDEEATILPMAEVVENPNVANTTAKKRKKRKRKKKAEEERESAGLLLRVKDVISIASYMCSGLDLGDSFLNNTPLKLLGVRNWWVPILDIRNRLDMGKIFRTAIGKVFALPNRLFRFLRLGNQKSNSSAEVQSTEKPKKNGGEIPTNKAKPKRSRGLFNRKKPQPTSTTETYMTTKTTKRNRNRWFGRRTNK